MLKNSPAPPLRRAGPFHRHHLFDHFFAENIVTNGRGDDAGRNDVWLGNFHALDWLGMIRARYQLRADVGPVRFEVATEFTDSHAVDSRCSFVALDPFQDPFEVKQSTKT